MRYLQGTKLTPELGLILYRTQVGTVLYGLVQVDSVNYFVQVGIVWYGLVQVC